MKIKSAKKLLLSVFGILSVVLLTVAASYAFFSYSRTGTQESSIESGSITFHYQEGSNSLSVQNAMPMDDGNGKTQTDYFDFTITSTTASSVKVPYYITARRKGNDNSLDSAVKFYLTEVSNKGEQSESETSLNLETGNQVDKFSSLSTYTNNTIGITAAKNEKILYIGEVPRNTNNYTKDYRLRMWLSNTAGDITYSQTETGVCSDTTYTTEETCVAGHKDWTRTATATTQTFTVTINVYAEGESQVCNLDPANANNVEMLLTCAGVNQNYTTINQVLADTNTLQQVISSEEGAEFLALSTDWANTITSNETAMTYIGANNYAADTLLNNSTWLSAIRSSQYKDSVFLPLMPVMTSNTTPSGTSSGYALTQYDYYMAVEGTPDYCFVSSGGYTQYTFDNPVKVYRAKFNTVSGNSYAVYLTGQFQYLDESTNTWVNVPEANAYNNTGGAWGGGGVDTMLTDPIEAKSFRLVLTTSSGQTIGASNWQIYGRETS